MPDQETDVSEDQTLEDIIQSLSTIMDEFMVKFNKILEAE